MKAVVEPSWGAGYTINGAIVRMFENVAHFRQKEQKKDFKMLIRVLGKSLVNTIQILALFVFLCVFAGIYMYLHIMLVHFTCTLTFKKHRSITKR